MIDLHCHSTFSDGLKTPAELVDMALEKHLTALALTDHDTTAGVPALMAAGQGKAIELIPGTELSVDCDKGVMHMLGYWMDPDNQPLNEAMDWVRNGRDVRNHKIVEKLQALGYAVTWDEVAARVGADGVMGRPHIALTLVDKGIAKDWNDAFDRFLGTGKAAYVERDRLTAEKAIALIRGAGGVAVLAHPFTLHLELPELDALLGALAAQGLAGMECYYSEHSFDQCQAYLDLAHKHTLVPTGGSDYHGKPGSNLELGSGFGGLNVPDETVALLRARLGA
ncbi:MAG: PHP domain-containing protein [Kiritimatiellae bacterium]|nr:PHP domain-containing protein [Kiritimatiellia bacterium]